MDPRAAALCKLADDIAEMHRRLAVAAGSDVEAMLKLGVARMIWTLDQLIDESEGIIEEMPWWNAWSRCPPAWPR
jgi:pyruvate kinase